MHTDDTPIESSETDDSRAPHSAYKTRYEPHYDDAGKVVWMAIDEPVSFTPETNREQPTLNRAQRRHLSRYIARKTHAQMTVVKRRNPWARDAAKTRCPQCNLLFLGPAGDRCQCRVPSSLHFKEHRL